MVAGGPDNQKISAYRIPRNRNQMVKPVTTEAADGIELKPETLLAYEMHPASVDSAVEQIQRQDRQFLWADACPERLAQMRRNDQFRCPTA
jgi:hypothetical protein